MERTHVPSPAMACQECLAGPGGPIEQDALRDLPASSELLGPQNRCFPSSPWPRRRRDVLEGDLVLLLGDEPRPPLPKLSALARPPASGAEEDPDADEEQQGHHCRRSRTRIAFGRFTAMRTPRS